MRVVILGGGGHARSVIAALRSAGGALEPVACTDPDPALTGTSLDGIPIVGDDTELSQLLRDGVTGACLGVGGVQDNRPRAALFARARTAGFALPAVIHAAATIPAEAELADGSQVLAGAVVGPGATIGEDAIVNTGAIVEHDGRIGAHAHIATAAALGGGVVVGALSHIGLGARVIQGIRIGAGCVVGAGAVVIRDVPDGHLAVGCPAVTRPYR